ncbi:hypothetical protein WR25_22158 [Diploscapter pachys]|uniref:Uncharacterized protein n=1 Tax=Diploscapter pachys TaxID=2018661 RepID=A0A2A2KIV8_9BILA|nr:hypothetical protein WR25_22158 [Diploscapter pachys]
MTRLNFLKFVVVNMALRGNAFALIERNVHGTPIGLVPLDGRSVKIDTEEELIYLVTPKEGETFPVSPEYMLHFKLFSLDGIVGLSPIEYQAETMGLAKAGQQWSARFMRKGGFTGGYVIYEQFLTEAQQARIMSKFPDVRKGDADDIGKMAILQGNPKIVPAGISQKDAQFIESQQFQEEALAGIYGPYIDSVEDELNDKLFGSGQRFVEFVVEGLLRADSAGRASYFQAALGGSGGSGWLSIDEVREKENYPPLGGDYARLKSVDEAGNFEGYAAVFNNVDLGDDVILPGAFTRVKATRKGQLKLALYHDLTRLVGAADYTQDDHGLLLKGQVNLNVSYARDAYELMKADILDSIIAMSEVKELKDSIELQLKNGFGDLQKKYDAAMDEMQKGNQVTGDLRKQIEDTKGELQKVTSAGIVAPVYDPVIQPGIRQELRIRDLLTSVPVAGQNYTYFREKLHTRGAAPVAEGGLKPTSNVTFETVTDRVKKIAVWMPVTDEALDDVPQMLAYLQQLLRYDLKLEEEAQILKGDARRQRQAAAGQAEGDQAIGSERGQGCS